MYFKCNVKINVCKINVKIENAIYFFQKQLVVKEVNIIKGLLLFNMTLWSLRNSHTLG